MRRSFTRQTSPEKNPESPFFGGIIRRIYLAYFEFHLKRGRVMEYLIQLLNLPN
jgi:hypothetical protein